MPKFHPLMRQVLPGIVRVVLEILVGFLTTTMLHLSSNLESSFIDQDIIDKNKKSEPSTYRLKVRISRVWWSIGDSNS